MPLKDAAQQDRRREMQGKKGRKKAREKEKRDQAESEGNERRSHSRESYRRLEGARTEMKEVWEEMGRCRSQVLSRRREKQNQRALFEASLGSSECPAPDFLLGCVKENLDLLVQDLIETTSHHHHQIPLLKELILLHWRSRDMLSDFSGFYCIRLVLDEQSPLATQFMDFFCDLQWLMIGLVPQIEATISGTTDTCMPSTHIHMVSTHTHKKSSNNGLIERCNAVLASLKPVVHTCIALHCLYKLSHKLSRHLPACGLQRAVVNKPRMFSQDVYHCLARTFGVLEAWNLDSYIDIKVELDEEPIGEGAFASVCKGHFVRTASGQIIGDPVAVKVVFQKSSELGSDYSSSIFTNSGNDGSSSSMEDMHGYSNLMDCLLGMSEHGLGSTTGECLHLETPHISELRKLASLQHPNIVVVKGYIARRELNNGRIAESGIVMELMDGSLDKIVHHIQEEGEAAISELEMVDLMLEIARAMRFMHECGVTHRDLKPANILLRYTLSTGPECLEVKVGDFGYTKCIPSSHIVEHTTYAGTTGYMAPELRVVNRKAAYTDKVDVYSYGITCLDIITGVPDGKIRSGKQKELYSAVVNGEWKDWVKAKRPSCPSNLVNVIERCLQSNPSCRPTFAEICFALQQSKRCLLWPCPTEPGLSMTASNVKWLSEEGEMHDELTSSEELILMKGLSLGKVVCHTLAGTQLMNSLVDDIPEPPHISVQGYFAMEGEEQHKWKREKEREAEEVAKAVGQHQNWKNEVLVEAISNVIAMAHPSSQTPFLISKSKKLLHALNGLCTHLIDDIFTRFSRRCECPYGCCECDFHNFVDQKVRRYVGWEHWIVNELPQPFLEFDGIKELYVFGDLVDMCAGVKLDTFTPTEIEAMRLTYSRKYLLYHGLYCPLTKSGWRSMDVLNDFKAKWIKHEVISTLMRWSWIWKKTSGVSVPIPWDEDVIDYTLICKSPASPKLTLGSSFDLSLSAFLRARKPLPLLDLGGDNACSSFNEDQSMLPLLKCFYLLYQ